MHHLTMGQQLISHCGGQIDRDGKAEPSTRARAHQGVDSNHIPIAVDQGPSGVAGVDGGIGLNQIQTFV